MKPYGSRYLIIPLIFVIAAIAVLFTASAWAAERGKPAKKVAGAEQGSLASECLKCHGPFEKLNSAPPGFATKSGEKVNPHMYVPHDQKEIPDCVTCHKPHSLSPDKNELARLPKPNVDTCYSCHHTENFQNCKSCHQGK